MKKWLKTNSFYIIVVIIALIIFSRVFRSKPQEGYSIYNIMNDSLRRKQAEISLQKFNDSILKKIAFKGTIIKTSSARTNYAKDSNFIPLGLIEVKIDGNIYNPENLSLDITRIYNFRNLNKAKIYFKSNGVCYIDDSMIGHSLLKKYGEDFYQIKFNSNKNNDKDLCKEFKYTLDFDYFYTHN